MIVCFGLVVVILVSRPQALTFRSEASTSSLKKKRGLQMDVH